MLLGETWEDKEETRWGKRGDGNLEVVGIEKGCYLPLEYKEVELNQREATTGSLYHRIACAWKATSLSRKTGRTWRT